MTDKRIFFGIGIFFILLNSFVFGAKAKEDVAESTLPLALTSIEPRPGSVDTSSEIIPFTWVTEIGRQSDGKILVAGILGQISKLIRLHPDGKLDSTFNLELPKMPPHYNFNSFVVQPDDSIIIGGDFKAFEGSPQLPNLLMKVTKDGKYDPTFISPFYDSSIMIWRMKPTTDGSFWVAGHLMRFRSESGSNIWHCVLRLKPDGMVDRIPNLSLRSAITGLMVALQLLPDGSILVGGTFGFEESSLIKRRADGILDSSFQPMVKQQVRTIALAKDFIYIGGVMTTINGQQQPGLARLDHSGTLDDTFRPVLDQVNTIIPLPDTRIVIGGDFNEVNGKPAGRIAVLHYDGTLDESFSYSPGANGIVSELLLLETGKLLVGGTFSKIDNADYPGLAKLHFFDGPEQPLKITSIQVDNGTITIRLSTAPNENVRLQASTDLITWTDQTTVQSSSGDTVEVSTKSSTHQFFRLVTREGSD